MSRSTTSVSAADCVHSALLYADTAEYLAAVAGFVRDGLAAQEPVAVAVPHARLAQLTGALAGDAPRVRLYDMTDAGSNPGRILPTVLYAFADAHPTRRVRIVSEAMWPGRTPDEFAACLQHEALVNVAFAGRPVAIMCPYPRRELDGAALANVHATHPVLIDSSGGRRSDLYTDAEVLMIGSAPLSEPTTAFSLFFDRATFAEVRPAAMAHARRSGMPDRRVYAVGLAASELATNSIRYGGGSGTLRIWTDGGLLICEVRDRGRLDDPLAGRRPVPPSQLSGRGLLLVNLMTDLVQTRSTVDGTTVRFHLSIDRADHDGMTGGG